MKSLPLMAATTANVPITSSFSSGPIVPSGNSADGFQQLVPHLLPDRARRSVTSSPSSTCTSDTPERLTL